MQDYPLSLGLEPIQFEGVKMIVADKLLDADIDFDDVCYGTPDDYPEFDIIYIDGLTAESRQAVLEILENMYDILDYDFDTKNYPPREGALTLNHIL
jgi:hypothetical protein